MEIELRFLKGKWEFGKFKLQYRKVSPVDNTSGEIRVEDWTDVPIVNESPEWCEHWKRDIKGNWLHDTDTKDKFKYLYEPPNYLFCQWCGKPRPK